MKFARYLEDSQTPEWKRAYIDYRGLKKCIADIRNSQEEYTAHFSRTDSPPPRSHSPTVLHITDSVLPKNVLGLTQPAFESLESGSQGNYDHVLLIQPPEKALRRVSWYPEVELDSRRTSLCKAPAGEIEALPSHILNNDNNNRRHQANQKRRRHFSFSSYLSAPGAGIDPALVEGLPFSEVSRLFTLQEQQFFVKLDTELEKVDAFYSMKEGELQARTRRLSEQLKELANHKRIVHKKRSSLMLCLWPLTSALGDRMNSATATIVMEEEASPSRCSKQTEARGIRHSNDPDNYMYAKSKLKKAIMEHYREIEALINYRILNITGFRKALKKFEKFTKIPVQEQYMSEKVEKCGFISNRDVKQMMQEMEKHYAETFARNDSKTARDSLRGGGRHVTSHHFSTFRSGICLGIAFPLFICALYNVSQQSIRDQNPYWESILHIYAVLFLPAIYPVLVSLNIFVWSRFHINYVFIFELDIRTRIDRYKYLELPTFIFATFCLAFWLSFSEFSRLYADWNVVSLAWLGFVSILLLNPLRIWFKDSRYWFLKLFGNLFLSGIRRVEFADFWLADQLCSFTYTCGSLVYIICIYTVNFNEQSCGSEARIWAIQWSFASLPMFIRLAQCVKRYSDTRQRMHLVNASRYGSGIIATLFFYLWRASGTASGYLAAWCMANLFYSLFSCVWDFCMDWSILTLQSPYPLLREELVYSNYIYVYHIAIILNVILRFVWIIYIPVPNAGLDFRVRSFIAGFLEMLRRLQWNFFRVENEHLGNVDQYRIVREVPLPYTFDDDQQLDDDEGSPGGMC